MADYSMANRKIAYTLGRERAYTFTFIEKSKGPFPKNLGLKQKILKNLEMEPKFLKNLGAKPKKFENLEMKPKILKNLEVKPKKFRKP